jgi:hypothetical protein
MTHTPVLTALLVAAALVNVQYVLAGQAPSPASDPDIPISHHDRVYSAEQYSNPVSVTDPVDNTLLGPFTSAIRCRRTADQYGPPVQVQRG